MEKLLVGFEVNIHYFNSIHYTSYAHNRVSDIIETVMREGTVLKKMVLTPKYEEKKSIVPSARLSRPAMVQKDETFITEQGIKIVFQSGRPSFYNGGML